MPFCKSKKVQSLIRTIALAVILCVSVPAPASAATLLGMEVSGKGAQANISHIFNTLSVRVFCGLTGLFANTCEEQGIGQTEITLQQSVTVQNTPEDSVPVRPAVTPTVQVTGADVRRTVVERVIERVVNPVGIAGVSQEYVDGQLAALAADLRSEIGDRTVTVRTSSGSSDDNFSRQIDSIYEDMGDLIDDSIDNLTLISEDDVIALIGANSATTSLVTFDTDDLAEGSTNLYSQWSDILGGINYSGNVTATAFYGDGSNLTGITSFSTSTTRAVFSSTAPGLTYTSGTGVFSLESGYTIPLTASTTEWTSKVSSQWATSGANISYVAGGVSIGTTTSSAKLDIFSITEQMRVGYNASNYLTMTVMSDGEVVLDSVGTDAEFSFSDNIGINTTNPLAELDVYGSSGGSADLDLMRNDSSTVLDDQLGTLNFGSTDGPSRDTASIKVYAAENHSASSAGSYMTFTTTPIGTDVALERLRINNDGNIGIGTTTPGSLLTVAGESLFSGASGAVTTNLNVTNQNQSNSGATFINVTAGTTVGGISARNQVYGFHGMAGATVVSGSNALILNSGTSAQTGVTTDNISFRTGGFGSTQEKMRLTNAGYLGIGTTTPERILSLYGSQSSGAENFGMVIRNILSTGYSELAFNNDTTTSGGAFVFGYGGSATSNPNEAYFYQRRNASLLFGTNNTTRMTITGSGNVGIGTTTPGYPLTVAGDVSLTGALRASGNAGTAGMLLQTTGSGVQWVATSTLGSMSLSSLNSLSPIQVGNGNTASGSLSSAFGYGNVASQSNSQVFGLSNFTSTTGTSSVAMGILNNSTGATFNTSTGVITGTASATTTVGISSTAVGIFNRAVGDRSSAFGLSNVITGPNSVGIGQLNVLTGTGNSVLGYSNITALNYSVAVGYQNNATGNVSMGLGYTNDSTGTNSMAIGFDNTSSNTESFSIGRSNNVSGISAYAFGDGIINTITSSMMLGPTNVSKATILSTGEFRAPFFSATSTTATSTFAAGVTITGNVGIGTTTPAYKLSLGSGQIAGPDGTVSAPTYSFTGYPNMGMYTSITNVLQFSTGGAERFRMFNGGVESSGQLRGAGGSASTPTLVGASDTNTGVFFLGSDILGLSTGGTERFRIDASGNVGIGTTTPVTRLDVWGSLQVGTSSTALLYADTANENIRVGTSTLNANTKFGIYTSRNSSSFVYGISSNVINSGTGPAAGGYFKGTATGDGSSYGIVVEAGPSALEESVAISATADPSNGFGVGLRAAADGGTGVYTSGIYGIQAFSTNAAGRAGDFSQSDASGYAVYATGGKNYFQNNVGIGTTTPARKLHVFTSADEAPVRFQDANGYCEINPTSTTWTCTSDERLKDNITDLADEDVLERLSLLRPVNFSWKSDDSDAQRAGLIAQEVELLFPELVNTDERGYKSVSYGGFTIYFISAIKQLAEKVESIAAWFGEGRFNISGDVCVDDVCVTKDEFKNLLQNGANVHEAIDPNGGGDSLPPDDVPDDVPGDPGTGDSGAGSDGSGSGDVAPPTDNLAPGDVGGNVAETAPDTPESSSADEGSSNPVGDNSDNSGTSGDVSSGGGSASEGGGSASGDSSGGDAGGSGGSSGGDSGSSEAGGSSGGGDAGSGV